MKAFNLLFLSGAGLVLAASEPAPVVLNNVLGSCALADFSTKLAGSNVTFRIEVAVEAASNKRGVNVTINMNGGPGKPTGPYMYHIHEKPVPSDGDCKATGGHLDPTERGESPACDPRDPSSCQVGDLAGIFGNCSTLTSCTKSFQDPYLSLSPSNPAYIGDRSFVVHDKDKNRIACTNFHMQCAGQNTSSPLYPTAGLTGTKGDYNTSLTAGGNSTTGSGSSMPKGSGAPTSVPNANAAAGAGAVLMGVMWAMLLPLGVAAL